MALGVLGGFTLRTIGIFGFTKHGITPSLQAAISVIVEVAALLLLAAWQRPCASRRMASRVPNNHPYSSRRMSILVARAAVDLATGCQGRVNWYPARVSGAE